MFMLNLTGRIAAVEIFLQIIDKIQYKKKTPKNGQLVS